jgi:hypothetical protein
MHIDAKPAVGIADDEHDGLARLMPDGIGHQLAGEQEGDVLLDGDRPGLDGGPDPAAGLGRRGRSRGQGDAEPMPFGRSGRRRRGHRVPSCAGPAGPGPRPGGALLDVS